MVSYEDCNESLGCIICGELTEELSGSHVGPCPMKLPYHTSLIQMNSVCLLLQLERVTGSHTCTIITQKKMSKSIF